MSGEYRAVSIDARLLAEDAQSYYASYGYMDTPTPWLWARQSPRHATARSRGAGGQSPVGGYHVGSAEQGFMLMADDAYTRARPEYQSLLSG